MMEPDRPPPPDPFLCQESRQERGARHAATRRHRFVVGSLIAVAVLAAAAYGIYRVADTEGPPADTAGSSLGSLMATSDPPPTFKEVEVAPTESTGAIGAGTTGTSHPAGNSGAVTTTEVPTTTTQGNLPPQRLEITANPEFVKLAITLQDGTVVTGKTPFAQQIPGGRIHIEFEKGGYNTTSRDLVLDRDTAFKIWLDPEGQLYQSLVRFKCGPSPKQIAFTPDGEELWVSLLGGHGLEVYEPTTGKKLGEVKLGRHGAVEIIFTRDGRTVYASQMETASVYEIDRLTRTVTRHFTTGGSWTKVLLLSSDEKTLWASNWVSSDVSEINLVTGELVRRMPAVVTPRGLYATPDGKWLYVAGYENGDIQKIDLSTGKGTVLFKTGGAMRHMVADEAAGRLYVDDMSTAEVFVVDLATDKVAKLADTDQRPNSMDLSPDGRVLYVSNRGKDNPKTYYIPGPEWGTILAIDTATGTVLDAIVGGNQCTGLDVSPDGSLLAFSDFLDDKIRVYTIPDHATLIAGGGGRADERFEDMIKD